MLADAPVAYWRLGEQAGDAQDSSGFGREAVANGGIIRQQLGALNGDPDAAVKFNGSTGYLQAPAFALAGPFSIEGFVKPNAYPGVAPTYQDFVIQRSGYNANGVIGQWTASNVFNFGASMYPGGNAYFFSAVNRDPTLWWHLVFTYDPTRGAVLYTNGAADVSRPDIVGVPQLGSQPWTMATGIYPAQTFSGCSLDEVAIYAAALSPTRVLAHYQAAVAATTRGGARTLTPKALAQLLQAYGQLIDIAGRTDTPDGAGGFTSVWAPKPGLGQILAVVGHPVAGGVQGGGPFSGEKFQYGELIGMGTREVLVAYNSTISVKDRIVVASLARPLEIIGVNDPMLAHEFLLLACYEVEP